MKKIILITALLCVSISSAQNWGNNKIKGNKKEVTVTRTTEDYDEISTGGSFSIELVSGKEGTITITGDENLLDLIITKVENKRLKIYIERGTWFDIRGERIKITVPFEKISKIDFGGSGKITTKNPINSDSLEINASGSGESKIDANTKSLVAVLSGSGNLDVSGSTTDITIKLSGSGEIDSSAIKSENASALLSGSGNIEINCTNDLVAKISGSGNIIYSGNPKTVEKKVSGSGNITKN